MEKKDYITKRDEFIIKEYGDKKITVRDLQLQILEIMDEIDRICRKNNIKYALHAGSALGAINYHGFIPWDDDIDIIIAKEDYLRFIEVLKKDLNHEKFDFQCFQTDKKYNVLIPNMKIRKKDTYIEEVNFLLKNRCKGSNGVFVDVSWYDGVSENRFIDQLYRTSIKLLMPIMVLLDNIHINPLPFKYLVEGIANHYAKVNHNSKYVSQTIAIPWEKFMHEPIFKREDIFPFKDCEFEGRTYMTYNNPISVVHKWYGPNCTKRWNGQEWEETYPVEKRKTKHVRNLNLESNEVPTNK